MIIKVFVKKNETFYGQDIDSWTRSWDKCSDIRNAAHSASRDYMYPLFKRYFPLKPGRILEGGCGNGKYVIAYREMGYDIVGVDFSAATIERIKADMGHDFPVFEGNILSLPFDDGYFDCYYSGGVIEHFENGPGDALSEAYRVLKKGGYLLATVPYVNILRKVFNSFGRIVAKDNMMWKAVNSCCKDDLDFDGYVFCEYFFDETSIKPFFEIAGFEVEKTYKVDFLFGEAGQMLHKSFLKAKGLVREKYPCHDNTEKYRCGSMNDGMSARNWLYDLLITENRENPFYSVLLDIMNCFSGHMLLVKARKV